MTLRSVLEEIGISEEHIIRLLERLRRLKIKTEKDLVSDRFANIVRNFVWNNSTSLDDLMMGQMMMHVSPRYHVNRSVLSCKYCVKGDVRIKSCGECGACFRCGWQSAKCDECGAKARNYGRSKLVAGCAIGAADLPPAPLSAAPNPPDYSPDPPPTTAESSSDDDTPVIGPVSEQSQSTVMWARLREGDICLSCGSATPEAQATCSPECSQEAAEAIIRMTLLGQWPPI